MYYVGFCLPYLTAMTNKKSGKHWTTIYKERDKIKNDIWIFLRGKLPNKPLPQAEITIVRHSTRAPDYDNLVSCGKAIIDALTESGVIEDDSLWHIGIPQFKWCKAKKDTQRTAVYVREVDEIEVPVVEE